MAEILRISYLDIVIMAMMPTILYYLGILLMIEIDARRHGHPARSRSTRRASGS